MRHRVLFVDDEALMLRALGRSFASIYSIWCAGSIEEALLIARDTELDVVVADLELKDPEGRDGFWLLEQLAQRPGIPGLVLTAHRVRHNDHLVLRKPSPPVALRLAIDSLATRTAEPEATPSFGRTGEP